MRILVVDDNATDRELITYVIGGSAHVIDSAETMAGALGLVDRAEVVHGQYDVVLLDLDLPDSRGATTYYRMRQRVAPVPIVIYSGSEDVETAKLLRRDGAAEYIVKRPGLRGEVVLAILEIAAAGARHPLGEDADAATLLQHVRGARRGLDQLRSEPPSSGRKRVGEIEAQLLALEVRLEEAVDKVDTARSEVVTLERATEILGERMAKWSDLSPSEKRRVGLVGGGLGAIVITIVEIILASGILSRFF